MIKTDLFNLLVLVLRSVIQRNAWLIVDSQRSTTCIRSKGVRDTNAPLQPSSFFKPQLLYLFHYIHLGQI